MFKRERLSMAACMIVGCLLFVWSNEAAPPRNDRTRSPRSNDAEAVRLAESVRRKGALLKRELGDECNVVVRSPFVIAGDMSTDELDRWHRDTIAPAAEAMDNLYFDVPPSEPITVLLFTGEESYNRYARQLFGDEGVSVYGYYKPERRTLVMNIGTGGGTLVHELAHALMAFDFPEVPDWFNEGLASLYEQCEFGERGGKRTIHGLVNWRLPALQRAVREERLRSLGDLMQSDDFRGRGVGLNYAQARYFCMYLQEQGSLADFFRVFKRGHKNDPQGIASARAVVGDSNWKTIDRDFQEWVLRLEDHR
jgi:hypothetical protein